MATIDDLYTQLSQAKKTWAPLRATLDQQAKTWNTAISQLQLPGGRPSVPGGSAPTYSVTDLPALAVSYLQAQAASAAAKQAMDAINAEIQTAITAKG